MSKKITKLRAAKASGRREGRSYRHTHTLRAIAERCTEMKDDVGPGISHPSSFLFVSDISAKEPQGISSFAMKLQGRSQTSTVLLWVYSPRGWEGAYQAPGITVTPAEALWGTVSLTPLGCFHCQHVRMTPGEDSQDWHLEGRKQISSTCPLCQLIHQAPVCGSPFCFRPQCSWVLWTSRKTIYGFVDIMGFSPRFLEPPDSRLWGRAKSTHI